jgi:putative CocE/NonD family hydrolase
LMITSYQQYVGYVTEQGYAAVIADFRGTGASGGVKYDAFEAIESADVYDLVEGLAAQSWCDGNVGIWGVSYGGITALRAGAARPPHLRALVAIEGSTDPYEYEVVRNGAPGMAMITGEWASLMLCLNALPPINGTPHGDVAAVISEHLEALTPWQFAWRDHPTRDSYWQGREVDPASIDVPAMIITSWRDTNPIGAWRDYAALSGPRRIIAGPWQHGLPDTDATDPIHSLHEMVRWFDTWLRKKERGLDSEAPVNLYVLGTGQWESHAQWPPQTRSRTLYLTVCNGLLDTVAAEVARVPVHFDATVGMCGGLGMAHPPAGQGRDDARSTVFDSEPLSDALQVVGRVEVALNVEFIQPETDIALRIVDVDPAGSTTLITKGFLRLSNPPPYMGEAIAPPSASVTIQCNPTRYHVSAGHRIRLAIAGADFPEIWPAEAMADYVIAVGGPAGSHLTVEELLDPPKTAPAFLPPDPQLSGPQAQGESTLEIIGPDAQGRASVKGCTEAAVTTFDGQPVGLTHSYRISTFARQPELTQLVTETCIDVQQLHRQIQIRTETYNSRDVATAAVSVTIDDITIFTKSFQHRPQGRVGPGS